MELALEWARKTPPPTVAALREAQIILQQVAEDLDATAHMLNRLDGRLKIDSRCKCGLMPWPFTLRQRAQIAAAEKRHIEQTLKESWPVDSEEAEKKAIAEMKSGGGVEQEDAFAKIAGLSKEDWATQVAIHKSKKK